MKRMIPLVLLVVFTACNNSFINKKQSFFCNRLVDKT